MKAVDGIQELSGPGASSASIITGAGGLLSKAKQDFPYGSATSSKRMKGEDQARRLIAIGELKTVVGSPEFYAAELETQLGRGLPSENCVIFKASPKNDF